MPTRALLLCGDEKALAAVTQVLAEMGVVFEQFPDPTSAGKRLTSQRFDLILIDCDDQQHATLAFDNVRKSSLNQNSMTLAVVDGKAGVPNAFRLGARLVLTKPVSLEQARGTLRNALAIQKREVDSKPSGAAAGASTAASTQPPIIAKTEESIPAPVAPTRLPVLTPTTPAPADWRQAQPETVASPLTLAAAAGTGAQNRTTTEMAPSAAVPPASPSKFQFKKEAASVAPPKLERKTDRSPEDEDLLMCELEDLDTRRKPVAASRKARGGSRRSTSPSFLAAVVLLLVGAGFYAGWTMKPGFRAAVLREYGKLHLLITGTPTSPQATTSAPKAAPKPVPSKASAAAKVKSSAKAGQAASSDTPVAEGFLAPDKSGQGSGNDTANNSGLSSVLLPTAATTQDSGDRGPLVVAAELADQHVSHRVDPFYPEPARRKRVEGDVVLRIAVNDDGTVDSVQVLDGNARLVAAAVEAVRQWRYELYYHNGQPAGFQTEVTLRFELPKKATH